MQLLRLRGRKNCERVLHKGNLWRGRHFFIRWMPGPPRHPDIDRRLVAIYTGAVASSRLDKSAVKRNRMRRRCREALRTVVSVQILRHSIQLLILPRSSSLKAPFGELQNDFKRFFSTAPHG